MTKINIIKWLKAMDINYYCSNTAADRNIQNRDTDNIHNKNISKPLINKHNHVSVALKNNKVTDSILQARYAADQASDLGALSNAIKHFDGCDLKNFANNAVFADGQPDSSLMLIGEAPGANEDAMGIPFCGESGKLLDNMFSTIGFTRTKNMYITNTVFWRPPANRKPTQYEIDICRPFVEKHIAIINPKLIVMVGATAVASVLGKNSGITNMIEEYYSYTNKYLKHNLTAAAIFHPAYLLRQPMKKKATWYHLLKIQDFMNS